jgi:ribosomal protein L37E
MGLQTVMAHRDQRKFSKGVFTIVSCRYCGDETTNTSTNVCGPCYNLNNGIRNRPDVALVMITDVLKELKEKVNGGR